MKLGQIKFSAQIVPNTISPERWDIFIRRFTCVRFASSGRIGWRWDRFEPDQFPSYTSRIEALRVARHHIKQLYARFTPPQT